MSKLKRLAHTAAVAIHRQLAVCRRIRGLREHAGLTQAQIAEILSISQAAYSRLEQGEVELSLSKLFTLSEIYGLSLQDLLRGL
jgi:transcriptional regulator with XRE-family HTH domain